MVPDRVQLNTPDSWLGPDFALGLVDEIVVDGVLAHLEATTDSAAYLHLLRGDRCLHLAIYARPTTRRERRQVLAHADERLVDHLARLIPLRWGGRTWWAVPVWRRPAACVREWWQARRAARAVLCVRVDENDLVGPEG